MAVVASSSAYVFPRCLHNLYIYIFFLKYQYGKKCVVLSHFPHCMSVLLFVRDASVKDVCCQNVYFILIISLKNNNTLFTLSALSTSLGNTSLNHRKTKAIMCLVLSMYHQLDIIYFSN